MTRRVVFYRYGDADVLCIEQVTRPTPAAGEVRIAVKAFGVNRAEINFRAGRFGAHSDFPTKLGHEAAGIVEAVGPEVSTISVGDVVSVLPMFSQSQYGTYGDSVPVPARAVVKHPPTLSWEAAAAVWMQYATAWAGLVVIAKIRAGDIVLISAASSCVGLAAIQIARRTGAIPVALTRDPCKSAALKRIGAAHVINWTAQSENIETQLNHVTGGKGAQVIFDSVGGSLFTKLIDAAACNAVVLV